MYMLLVLESNDNLRDPEEYDSMVRVEIPKLNVNHSCMNLL